MRNFKKNQGLFRVVCFFALFSFLSSAILPSYAQEIILPSPNQFVQLSEAYSFPALKGLKFDPATPFEMKFIIDSGNDKAITQQEASQLIKYFLAGLTIPEEELWVNMSPYEKERMITPNLAATDLGKDLLAQDYILKQISSSLTYPESSSGKDFWQKTYEEVFKVAKTTNLPVNTFNKIWIVPDKAVVYENEQIALVTEATLKVMLEEDYLALKHNVSDIQKQKRSLNEELIEKINKSSSQVMREVILPKINQDVNSGKNFATLRQIYYSLILATWFKEKFKQSIYKYYIDKGKVKGIDLADKDAKDKIYNLYVEAFKKGIYNYIKTDSEPQTKRKIKRRYFSGGWDFKSPDGLIIDSKPPLTESNKQQALALASVTDPYDQIATVNHDPISGKKTEVIEEKQAGSPLFTLQDTKKFLEDAAEAIRKKEKKTDMGISIVIQEDPTKSAQLKKDYAGGVKSFAYSDPWYIEVSKDAHPKDVLRLVTRAKVLTDGFHNEMAKVSADKLKELGEEAESQTPSLTSPTQADPPITLTPPMVLSNNISLLEGARTGGYNIEHALLDGANGGIFNHSEPRRDLEVMMSNMLGNIIHFAEQDKNSLLLLNSFHFQWKKGDKPEYDELINHLRRTWAETLKTAGLSDKNEEIESTYPWLLQFVEEYIYRNTMDKEVKETPDSMIERYARSLTNKVTNTQLKKIIPYSDKYTIQQTVLCVGETLSQRQAGRTQEVIGQDLREILEGINLQEAQKINLRIAYEPRWAIGTRSIPDPKTEIQPTHRFIKGTLKKAILDEELNVDYGGSLNKGNAEAIFSLPDVDGGLIGGAAKKPEEIEPVIDEAIKQGEKQSRIFNVVMNWKAEDDKTGLSRPEDFKALFGTKDLSKVQIAIGTPRVKAVKLAIKAVQSFTQTSSPVGQATWITGPATPQQQIVLAAETKKYLEQAGSEKRIFDTGRDLGMQVKEYAAERTSARRQLPFLEEEAKDKKQLDQKKLVERLLKARDFNNQMIEAISIGHIDAIFISGFPVTSNSNYILALEPKAYNIYKEKYIKLGIWDMAKNRVGITKIINELLKETRNAIVYDEAEQPLFSLIEQASGDSNWIGVTATSGGYLYGGYTDTQRFLIEGKKPQSIYRMLAEIEGYMAQGEAGKEAYIYKILHEYFELQQPQKGHREERKDIINIVDTSDKKILDNWRVEELFVKATQTSSPISILKIIPGTSMWLFAPSGNLPENLKRLKAEADEKAGEAFVKDRAFEFIPGQISFSAEGKPDSSTQKRMTELISGWKKTRAQDENLNQVLPDEENALTKDIITSLRFVKQIISEIEDPVIRTRLETETRFVFAVPRARPNMEQVELMEKELGIRPPVLYFYGPSLDASGKFTSLYYGEEAPGISLEDEKFQDVSVLGFGGRHPYKDSEAKTYAKAPSSLYIPLSRVKRYARLLDEAKTSGDQENGKRIISGFRSWLISTHSRISTNDTAISGEDEQNILFAERLAYEDFEREYRAYLELLSKTHKNRTREYKLDIELLRWLNVEFIPAELEDAVSHVLSNAKDQGEIAGFLVTRTGDELSMFISHKKSTQDNFIPQLAEKAVLASLAKAKEMGIFKAPIGEPDILEPSINKGDLYKGLRWRSGNVVYTIRKGAEPTLRVKYFGGSRKAFDLGMLDLYADIAKTTMGTIEGVPGWYYVSQKIEDLRQGNPEVQGTILRYPNDTDHLALEFRDEDWAYSAIFPGKQAKVRMDEPVAFVFLDSNYVEGENQVKNPNLRPFSPWIWVSQHAGKEAKGATEGVLLEPKMISGPDTYRSIQTMKVGEAPEATWARIKDEPIAVAIGIESHMTGSGDYDAIDVIDMLGRTTEYEDLQPLRDRLVDLLRRQGSFQYGLTTRFADMQGDRTWAELEEKAKGVSSSLVSKINNVKLGVPEALPDRKKGELPEHWDYTRNHQFFTLTIKKGDIGGVGHGSPHPYYEPAVEASFREIAKRADSGLKDFIGFSIGDDLQFLMSHQLGPLSDLVGQYAWEGFWRAGWIPKVLNLLPYAYMQDAPGAKDKNARDEAQLNDSYMELLQAELRTWSQEPGVQAYLKLNHLDVEKVIRQLLEEYRNPQMVKPKATGGVVQLAGNLIGSGFGNADLVVTPWLYKKTEGKFMAFGFDKTSPAVYNAIALEAARRAIKQGEFQNIYIDVQSVHNDRHVLLDVNNSFDTLLKLLGNSSRYQMGDIFTNDEEGNLHQLGAFTTDRLFQVLLALTGKPLYGGKDDPESVVAWPFGKYMIEVAREIGYYQVLGNERGSNIRLVRWTPVKRPYLGQYSDPTAAALLLSVDNNGHIIPQPDGNKFTDLLDTPEFVNLRQQVKDTQMFIKGLQGTIGPGTAADLNLLEPAYPATTNRENLLVDPTRKWPVRTKDVIARQHTSSPIILPSSEKTRRVLEEVEEEFKMIGANLYELGKTAIEGYLQDALTLSDAIEHLTTSQGGQINIDTAKAILVAARLAVKYELDALGRSVIESYLTGENKERAIEYITESDSRISNRRAERILEEAKKLANVSSPLTTRFGEEEGVQEAEVSSPLTVKEARNVLAKIVWAKQIGTLRYWSYHTIEVKITDDPNLLGNNEIKYERKHSRSRRVGKDIEHIKHWFYVSSNVKDGIKVLKVVQDTLVKGDEILDEAKQKIGGAIKLAELGVPLAPETEEEPKASSPMVTRVAINGFGEIGRDYLRAELQSPDNHMIVGINEFKFNIGRGEKEEKAGIETFINKLQSDFNTKQGSQLVGVEVSYEKYADGYWMVIRKKDGDKQVILNNGQRIRLITNPNPSELPWSELKVDTVIESTGVFTAKDKAAQHLSAGAKKVIISAPGEGEGIISIAPGVSGSKEDFMAEQNTIFDCASCTTNSLAAAVKELVEQIGIESYSLTTIHAFTEKDSALDIDTFIITATGAAQALQRIIPKLEGKGTGRAVRGPVKNGSLSDFTFVASRDTSVEEVNAILKKAAEGPLKGILGYKVGGEKKSREILGTVESGILQADETTVVGRLVTVKIWYDNVFSYTNRLVDLVSLLNPSGGTKEDDGIRKRETPPAIQKMLAAEGQQASSAITQGGIDLAGIDVDAAPASSPINMPLFDWRNLEGMTFRIIKIESIVNFNAFFGIVSNEDITYGAKRT